MINPPVPHPGELLLEELQARSRSQRHFANLIGKEPREVNYIIKGRKDIDADWSIRIGIVFGQGEAIRLWMQASCDIYNIQRLNKKEYKTLSTKQ